MELGSMLRFRRNEIQTGLLCAVQDELVVKQRGGDRYNFGPSQSLTLFREVGDAVEVPRYYGMQKVPTPDLDNLTVEGEAISIPFVKPLRPTQEPVVQKFLDALAKPGLSRFGGVLQAPCGSGKTVMGLYFIAKLGRPALILVHTEFLMKQWTERIVEFFGFKPEEIGRVQRDTCDWRGKRVVLGMVESIIAREYDLEMYRHFGVVVLDEVHRHSSSEWHKAIMKFPARVRIGLTATPRRADGLWNVIRWHVGEVLSVGESWEIKPRVFRISTGVIVPSEFFMMRNGKINLSRLVNILTRMESRTRIIVEELVKAAKAGRRVFVLSDRLNHLGDLQRKFVAAWELLPDPKPEMKIGHYVGGITHEQIDYARTCNLLFGTFQYAKEALDDPGLDTLFLTTPKSDVEQACGRLLRSNADKMEPFVIDFVDDRTGPCIGFGKSRSRQYESLGFDVTNIECQQIST